MDTNNNSNTSSSHGNGKKILVVIVLVIIIAIAFYLLTNTPLSQNSVTDENSPTSTQTGDQAILQELSKNQAPAPTPAEQQKVLNSMPKSNSSSDVQKQAVLSALSQK